MNRATVVVGSLWIVAAAACSDDPTVEPTPPSDVEPSTLNACATVTSLAASPLQVAVGFEIVLEAEARDPESDDIAFRWSATAGTITADAPISAGDDLVDAAAVYVCPEPGDQTITVQVSDTAFVGCIDEWSTSVACVAARRCGNGAIDPGEECDPPDGVTCSPDCENLPFCGDETIDPGEECDPPDGRTCDAECRTVELCGGVSCDDDNECTEDACDDSDMCVNTPVTDGTACNGGVGTCEAGACVAPVDPDPVTQAIPLACRNSFNQQLSDIPFDMTVDPGPIVGGEPFTVEITAVAKLTQEFLQGASDTLDDLGVSFTFATMNVMQVTVTVRSGASGDDVVCELVESPVDVTIPIEPGSDPPLITGDLEVMLTSEMGSYVAEASGSILFDVEGAVPVSLAFSTPATPTHIVALAEGIIGVAFACESGTVDDNGTPDDITDDTIEANPESALIRFDIE